MPDNAASSTATQMAQNSMFERLARAGYVVSGLLHLIIGYLAIRIALGVGSGTADQSGALAALAAKPGGIVALWVAVVALVVTGLWRLVETVLGRSNDPKSQGASSEVLDRVKAFALAVVYFAFAYSAFGFARGAGKSTGAQNSGMSARLMQTGAGTIALIAAGVIIVAVGAYHVYKGASRNFVDDLKGNSSDLVRRLGTVGYIAKGLVIAGAGVLVIVAASRSQPNTATGRRGPQNTRGPTLRRSAPHRGRPGNHHLRPVQLRHGAIHQNVSGSGGLSLLADPRPRSSPGRRADLGRIAAATNTGTRPSSVQIRRGVVERLVGASRLGTDKQDRLTRSGLIASCRLPCRAWSSAIEST